MTPGKFSRFLLRFKEQVEFIQTSCKAYDGGAEAEALRIAVCLRLLFHQTKSSTSLIKHLNFERKPILSAICTSGKHLDLIGYKFDLNARHPVQTAPRLGSEFNTVKIAEWWSQEAVLEFESRDYFRKDIVCDVANKDGGAHVDEDLPHYFSALYAGGPTLGIAGNLEYSGGPPPFEQGVLQHPVNGHLALIRQFAHEVLTSVKHFNWIS